MKWHNYLFPELCCLCREKASNNSCYLCSDCLEKINYSPEQSCRLCSAPLDTILEVCHQCATTKRSWSKGIAPLQFDGTSREIIHQFKYNSKLVLSRFLIQSMSQAWLKHNIPKPSAITMVPMHWYRQWRRGYNQAEILAKGLAEKLDIPFTPLLKRHHWTSAQALKNRLQRRENMRNIFTANEKQKSPQGAILLIDDVITTGATLEACSQALIKSGAEKVYILTAARG